MARLSLRDRVEQGVFVLDGAMGTQLFARGVEVGVCNDNLNVQSPDVVCDVHRAYIEAGSDAVLTNTFGANKYALSRHGLAGQVAAINRAGAEVARRAAGDERYVLGDIGPSGDFLPPVGTLKPDELGAAFAEQAEALVAGGVDGLLIETMTALDEVEIAIKAAKSVAGPLPVFASMSFDKKGGRFRTMMGVDVASAVSCIVSGGADGVGFNCGSATLEEYVELAEKLVSTAKSQSAETIIFAEPNAGKPELVDGNAIYRVSPGEFAAEARKIHYAGIAIVGGCCGTTPEHIKALADVLRA
ncbi:MAG: homocysteine S-methyltransferase family protein [Planctomycetota bacterium]|jgi:methionine synthase I (cobalamin-dependent)